MGTWPFGYVPFQKGGEVSNTKYNDEAYNNLITTIFHDMLYIESSYKSKMHLVREFSEIVVRRLSGFYNEFILTLGNERSRNFIKSKGIKEDWFWEAVDYINQHGSDSSHTHKTEIPTEDDFKMILDHLFTLYAYLFYNFFKKHSFGSNTEIVSKFSLLPPIIRYKTLEKLYDDNQNNTLIIDKLVLAIIKAYDKKQAVDWVDINKDNLCELHHPIDPEYKQQLIGLLGEEAANRAIAELEDNMYDYCLKQINLIDEYTSEFGILYDDFESAAVYYRQEGHINGTSREIVDFNSLMEFVYCGRQEREKELQEVRREQIPEQKNDN